MSVPKRGPVYDPGLCRCCGNIKKCRLLNVEYDHLGQKEIYSDIFVDCFGFILSQLDGEPDGRLICATCVIRLREANSFRLQVLLCEERLLARFQDDDKPIKEEIIIKDEVSLDAEPMYDDEPADDIHSDNTFPKEEKKEETSLSLENIITLVENSYVCPFDTSFSDYFCVYCRTIFTDPIKLREHTYTHDPQTIKDVLAKYTATKKIQLDLYRVDCRLCTEVITDIGSLKRHLASHGKTVHEAPNEFLEFKLTSGKLFCLECGRGFAFFHALKKHMAQHFGTCICDVCGAHYFEERMLYLHQKTHQKSDEVFKCVECGKEFKSKYTRYLHIFKMHKNEAAYPCSKCDEMFFSYSLRYRHKIDVHGEERQFKCEVCDRSYDSRKSLREHNRRLHLKILKHACHMCDKRFYLPSRLKEHLATHTGERNFRCDFCGKTYPRLRGLKVHMQAHIIDKKFKCDLCGITFAHKVSLKIHLKRQHQNESFNQPN
ncbi:unnamed protein product [Leptidea sinapis]|uniref:C2H2-type domain-containing protein n=1 Tax=Leptidea sinapis TaxID=189913 RepID=A0A5E4R6C4_9NEOP|nr:unnamed protein product [Leptidea sinapis]